MPFCIECGAKLDKDDDFCPECGKKTKHKEKAKEERKIEEDVKKEKKEEAKPKVVERVVEREYHHEKPRSSGFGKFMGFLIILGIIIFIIFMVAQSGVLDEAFGGSGVPYIDPCEREFNECNHGCGEGWLSGACKEKCSYQYRRCRD